MQFDKIGGWSQAELRRFIVNLLSSDPGALPPQTPAVTVPIPGSKLNWNFGAAPPVAASAGDIWVYQGPSTYWMFVYDPNEATYKWKFVGGPPLMAIDTAQKGPYGSVANTWTDSSPVGPTIVAPFDGDYAVEESANVWHNTAGTWIYIGVLGGAASAGHMVDVAGNWSLVSHSPSVVTGLTAGTNIRQQYNWAVANQFYVLNARLAVWPVRVR